MNELRISGIGNGTCAECGHNKKGVDFRLAGGLTFLRWEHFRLLQEAMKSERAEILCVVDIRVFIPSHCNYASPCHRCVSHRRSYSNCVTQTYGVSESTTDGHTCSKSCCRSDSQIEGRSSGEADRVVAVDQYLRHASDYYGPCAGLEATKTAVKIVRELYGMTPVATFGPKKLAAVREAFSQKGWSRPYINSQIGKIIRAFK